MTDGDLRQIARLVSIAAIGALIGAMIGFGTKDRPVLIVDLNGSVAGQEVQR